MGAIEGIPGSGPLAKPSVDKADGIQAYAGDLSPRETWVLLSENPDAVLLDVRTQAEWTYVGVPDLSTLEKEVLFIEWQSFPGLARNPHFAEELAATGVRRDQPVLIICRSGVRSRHAAAALTTQGYRFCFNVTEGFEGDKDTFGHRGRSGGWKVAELPWQQK